MEVKKMQFKVKQRFRCRLSKELYEKNSVYETEDDKRAKSLQKQGFLGAEIKKKADKK